MPTITGISIINPPLSYRGEKSGSQQIAQLKIQVVYPLCCIISVNNKVFMFF
jgi:hypothetical protein